ncbi:MAG TPA: RNA methyltransferase [Terracidiphilus sp.]|nr:RNA methyltransferase [Terracidiphilus sp.]
MTPVRIVQSKQNARLKDLRRALAQPSHGPRGLVGIEGPNLLEEALRAGLHIPCVFVAQGSQHLLDPFDLPPATEILLVPPDILAASLATETPQLIAALVEPPDWTWAHLVGGPDHLAPLIVALAGLQDPGNLGTIIRSAEAFGADGILCLPGTVSHWNPKAIRASAGSLFRLPVLSASESHAIDCLREAGVKIWTTTIGQAQPADLVDLSGPVALLIGNEGNGVPAALAAKADGALTIPCPGRVESLNAAVAASVLLYEASRQRLIRSGAPPKRLGAHR